MYSKNDGQEIGVVQIVLVKVSLKKLKLFFAFDVGGWFEVRCGVT